MRRGLIAAIVGCAFALSLNVAHAASPSLGNIPLVLISDIENSAGTVDNNLFVFTDAFLFADYVTDVDTPASSLLWSYSIETAASGDIEVNAIGPIDPMVDNIDAPGALNIAGGFTTASFREIVASPTAGTAPFPAPAAGANGVDIPGVGITNDVIADLIVRWYVSDGTNNDMVDSMVFAVDTNLGDTGPTDTLGGGLTFTPVTLPTGWIFQNADGFATELTTSGTTGGLQISHAVPLPSTLLFSYTGIWTDFDLLDPLANGDLVALRAAISSSAANNASDGAKPRLRLTPDPEPASAQTPTPQGIDFAFTINENDAASPYLPALASPGSTYVAYFAIPGHGTAGRHGAAFDHDAAQASGGTPRTVTMHSIEVATGSAATFTGSATTVPSGTFSAGGFNVGMATGWNYLNLDGAGVFGGIEFWHDGTSNTSGGRIGHDDTNNVTNDVGGLAFFNAGDPTTGGVGDTIEYTAGAIYLNSFDVVSADVADAGRPAIRPEARALNPSIQQSYTLRSNGDHWGATDPGPATYDLVWTAPDNGAAGPTSDDLIIGFDLFNVNQDGQHGGTAQLDATTFAEISSSDPNNP